MSKLVEKYRFMSAQGDNKKFKKYKTFGELPLDQMFVSLKNNMGRV